MLYTQPGSAAGLVVILVSWLSAGYLFCCRPSLLRIVAADEWCLMDSGTAAVMALPDLIIFSTVLSFHCVTIILLWFTSSGSWSP